MKQKGRKGGCENEDNLRAQVTPRKSCGVAAVPANEGGEVPQTARDTERDKTRPVRGRGTPKDDVGVIDVRDVLSALDNRIKRIEGYRKLTEKDDSITAHAALSFVLKELRGFEKRFFKLVGYDPVKDNVGEAVLRILLMAGTTAVFLHIIILLISWVGVRL